MTETINRLEQLLKSGFEFIATSAESELTRKATAMQWSKKEILGHLIDSGINNLQRFTEIQFESKPFAIRKYKQDDLIKANDYQNSETKELLNFWLAINTRIKSLMKQQTENTLKYEIELDKHKKADLRFLMTDYVDHLEHHLKQIIE